MQVDDVETIGAQPAQGEVDAPDDRVARPIRHARNSVTDLGGEDDLLAPASEMAADPLLRGAVARGGVDEGEAEVERPGQQTGDLLLRESRGSEGAGPQAKQGNFGAGR